MQADSKTDPVLSILAAPGLSALMAHDLEARRVLPAMCELLRRQAEERRALLEQPLPRQPDKTYRTLQEASEKLYPSGPVPWRYLKKLAPTARTSRTSEYRIKTTGTFLDALLRDYEEHAALGLALFETLQALAPAQSQAGSATGPMADDGLGAAAHNAYAFCVARGIPAPWRATVGFLEDLGWELGPGTLHAKSERLRKRATRAN